MPDKSLTPLPAKHVDTGMGFERVTAVIAGQGAAITTRMCSRRSSRRFRRSLERTAYTGKLEDLKDTAYRVIADHIRTLTFALTDGAVPDKDGRGYVIRSILRRAERYGRQLLGVKQPFLYEIVPTVVELMGGAFPELKKNPQRVMDVIKDEEVSFGRTFDRGIKLFQRTVEEGTRKESGGTGDQR